MFNIRFAFLLRLFATETVKLCLAFRMAADVGVRRAALVAIHAALECFLSTFFSTSTSHAAYNPRGILDSLANLSALSVEREIGRSGTDGLLVPGESDGSEVCLHVFEEESMVAAVDWAASTLGTEVDSISRALKQQIVKTAISQDK